MFRSSAHFSKIHLCLIGGHKCCPFFDCVVFLILSCMSCLYILEINPCWSVRLQIFSPILFILFMVSFAVQKLLNLISPIYLFLLLFSLL